MQTGLSVGEGSKGTTVLANASARLDEVDELTRQGEVDAPTEARIERTLDTFTDQATEASDLLIADYANTGHADSIAQLRDFASSSLDQLAALEPLVPPAARDELIRAAGVLASINAEAAQQCPTCGGTPITSIPPVFLAAEQIFVPRQPAPSPIEQPDANGKRATARATRATRATTPGCRTSTPSDLGPGSVTDPAAAARSADRRVQPAPGPRQRPHRRRQRTAAARASDNPSIPVVSDLLDGVGQILEGVVDPLTGQTER